MSLANKVSSIYSITRAKDWRLSFVPFVIGCIYLWFVWFDVEFTPTSIIIFFASLVTTFGFAALGYFINEYYDIEIDFKSGKLNKLAFLPIRYRLLIFFSILLASVVPWFWLPHNNIVLGLAIFEVVLFILYSHPLFRLKEVPVVSNVIDSMYAYLVPLLLTHYIYSLYSSKIVDGWIVVFSIAVFYIGFRNILIHQVNDIFKDKRAGLKTLPSILGVYNTNTFIRILLSLEIIMIIVFFFGLIPENPSVSIWAVFYLAFTARNLFRFRRELMSFNLNIGKARHLTDSVYQIWFPLFMLIPLLVSDWKWIVLIPFQLILLTPFRIFKPLIAFVRKAYHYTIVFLFVYVRHFISIVVNYPIYLLFLLFGVNLQKERKSAIQFLKDKWF